MKTDPLSREGGFPEGATVRVLFFAHLQSLFGSERSCAIEHGDTIERVLERLAAIDSRVAPSLPSCRFAVNGAWADASTALQAGDEVALITPVSGG